MDTTIFLDPFSRQIKKMYLHCNGISKKKAKLMLIMPSFFKIRQKKFIERNRSDCVNGHGTHNVLVWSMTPYIRIETQSFWSSRSSVSWFLVLKDSRATLHDLLVIFSQSCFCYFYLNQFDECVMGEGAWQDSGRLKLANI